MRAANQDYLAAKYLSNLYFKRSLIILKNAHALWLYHIHRM